MSDLEQAFNHEMTKTYQEAVKIGYRPARFLQMLSENGGVETARIILSQPNTTDGFTTLWEKRRLDLSVEAVVLKPAYAPLFSADDRAHARARLAEVDYTPPWDAPATAIESGVDESVKRSTNRFVWKEGDVTITPPPQSTPAPASTTLVDRLAHAVETIQGGDRSRPYDSPKLDPLVAIFKQRFPSFTSQEYLDSERTYKLMAAERMQTLIGREMLQSYIDQGQFEEAKAAIIKSGQGSFKISDTIRQPNNLLNQWDLRALQDASAEPLVRRLSDLLYGDAPFAQRFDAWVALLTEKRPGVWPTATYFLMLFDPAAYIFIKPTQYQFFFKSVGIDEAWPTRPTRMAASSTSWAKAASSQHSFLHGATAWGERATRRDEISPYWLRHALARQIQPAHRSHEFQRRSATSAAPLLQPPSTLMQLTARQCISQPRHVARSHGQSPDAAAHAE